MNLTQTVKDGVEKVKTYWKTPPKGRYMNFREIAAYSGGGIGAYMLITLGTTCLLSATNTLLSSALGVAPTHMYLMYVIAVIANIPLTGIRANIIDNTRNKAGKYRPYIVSMGLPSAVICITMVWFPYNILPNIVGEGMIFGLEKAYIAKCAIIMVLNLLLHFFYYFFYDAYENLIHVLSPDSQERADVSSVKSVVYSFAPTLVNLFTPIIAQNIFHTNTTDIRVYRFLYPILGVLGILLCIIVYKYTEEKIVQARTHVVQIKFTDALRAVAKNKYFWIISLATWVGFLETSYANILNWLYNYGGDCSGNAFGIIQAVYGNASLWGMLAAPFAVRRWGKKMVLVVTNIFNILFILCMMLFVDMDSMARIWLVMGCLWLNMLMGSFMHILNPAIQADIRDYQQYKTGERIDGMFSAVTTIGTVITLALSGVLPAVQEAKGMTAEMAKKVTSDPDVLNRVLGTGKTVAQTLAEQLANGQDNYSNPASALYDPNILVPLVQVLVILAAIGATMNVVPYFWYDFNEKKQKSVVNVLKVRALFEDYGNGIVKDASLVETIDIIRESRELAAATPKVLDKKLYKGKGSKKQYRADVKYNESIEIAKFVCDELDMFSTEAVQKKVAVSKEIYANGINGMLNLNLDEINTEMAKAKAMPKNTAEEKELRKFMIELARNKKSAYKTLKKHFANQQLVQPDFSELETLFDKEDECDAKLKELANEIRVANKEHKSAKVKTLKAEVKAVEKEREATRKASKVEMDKHAYFARAAKPYLDAEKLIKQEENYKHFDDIAEQYEEAKARHEQAMADAEAKAKREKEEQKAYAAQLKAEKAAKKANKK